MPDCIPNIDSVFITYNNLPNDIENLGGNNLSLSTQLEEVQKKKAELKNALQSYEQMEGTLGESIRILEEKLSIQELEEKVKARRAVVDNLESKRRDLERRLKEPLKKTEPSPMPQRPPPTPQHAQKVEQPQKKEPMEVTVSTTPPANQPPKPTTAPAAKEQPKKPEAEKDKEQEKKKRRWF